jgi:hypothetical protein
MHFRCVNGFSRLGHALFGWGFILGCGAYWWFSFFGKCSCCFRHFVLMYNSSTFLFHTNNTFFFSFIYFLVGFNKRIMWICGDIMGLRSWESFQGPLARRRDQLPISFSGISLLFMEDCAPFSFLRNWVLVTLYLYLRFHIFDRSILEEYVS